MERTTLLLLLGSLVLFLSGQSNANPCIGKNCGPGKRCVPRNITCVMAPCKPVAVCIDVAGLVGRQPNRTTPFPGQCVEPTCSNACPNGRYMVDRRGCRTCRCAERHTNATMTTVPHRHCVEPTCSNACPNGRHMVDRRGCRTCRCAERTNNGTTVPTQPCPLMKCNPCPNGRYKHDSRGCRTCECADRYNNGTRTTPFPRQCVEPTCSNACPNGRYLVDRRGCRTCRCAERQANATTTPPCPVYMCRHTCAIYKTNSQGCRTCECVNACSSKVCEQHQICRLRYPSCGQRVPCGAATAACEDSSVVTSTCRAIRCRLSCQYGFQMDRHNCPMCRCRPMDVCQSSRCLTGQVCQKEQMRCSANTSLCDMTVYRSICRKATTKPGQCPTNTTSSSGGDDQQCSRMCSSDFQCGGFFKCCFNGCGMSCQKPDMRNVSRCTVKREADILANHEHVTNCTSDGQFEPVQCRKVSSRQLCMCVNPLDGQPLINIRPAFEPSQLNCSPNNRTTCGPTCEIHCPFGKVLDRYGCPTCRCNPNPCVDFNCPGKQTCVLMPVMCPRTNGTQRCDPVPMCKDAVNNGTCKFGSPLRIPGSRKEVFCGRGPNRQECPSSHACNVSSNGNAVCCPKDGKMKTGQCPRVRPGQVGLCQHTCKADSDCKGKTKCCSNGCGRVCVLPVPIRNSTCQEKLRETLSILKNHVMEPLTIPRCTLSGHWQPVQCNEFYGVCWCVERNGTEINGTQTRGIPVCRTAPKCLHGSPLMDPQTKRAVFCGRGVGRQNCPSTHACNISATDRFAFCCPKENAAVNTPTPVCKPGESLHACNPIICKSAMCPGNRETVCRINPCGGCSVEFYDRNNTLVNCTIERSDDVCSQPKLVGPCKARMDRYYFNTQTGRCELFYYGGCNGNDNNFRTMQECSSACHALPACQAEVYKSKMWHALHPEALVSRDDFIKGWNAYLNSFISPVKKEEPKGRGGVHQDSPHHDDEDAMDDVGGDWEPKGSPKGALCPKPKPGRPGLCVQQCVHDRNCTKGLICCHNGCGHVCVKPIMPPKPKSVCSLEKDIGPCRALVPRFYYNSKTKTCQNFNFGGCKGNGNNFESMYACMQNCYPGIKNMTGWSFPKCAATKSSYSFKQCTSGSPVMCWCVNESGKPIAGTLSRDQLYCNETGRVAGKSKAPLVCPGNVQPEICQDSCKFKSCDLHPGATCQADPCNACAVTFIAKNGTAVDCNRAVCHRPPQAGRCEAKLPRWYHSSRDGTCKQFTFGGCDSNGNNFKTKVDCTLRCNAGLCDSRKAVYRCGDVCANLTCRGFPEAACIPDACTCKPKFIDIQQNTPVDCKKIQSLCVRKRSHAIRMEPSVKDPNVPHSIPECTKDGAFKPKQCNPMSKDMKTQTCWCVSDTGIMIKESLKTGKDALSLQCSQKQVDSIVVKMSFDVSFDLVKGKQTQFKKVIMNALKRIAGISEDQISSMELKPGSILVEFKLMQGESDVDVASTADHLIQQVKLGKMNVDFEGKTLTAEPSSVGAKHQYDGDKGGRKEPKTASMLWIVGVVAGVVVAGVLVGAVIFVCQRNSKGSEPANLAFTNQIYDNPDVPEHVYENHVDIKDEK